MMLRIALNGFGRIGRVFISRLLQSETGAAASGKLRLVAVNDLMDTESAAYLFKYDTVHGVYPGEVEHTQDALVVDGLTIPFYANPNPADCPWGDLQVDVVVEATGRFTSFDDAYKHQQAGARRVVITAPVKESDGGMPGETILVGVNDEKLKTCTLSSNGSCTTNSIATPLRVLDEVFGVERSILTTVHSYTSSQRLVDMNDPKKRRLGRAGAMNIIPTSTGAAIATAKVLPQLTGKFDGVALRVPTICGSIADITAVVKRPTSVDEVNDAFRAAAGKEEYRSVLAVAEDDVVSSDIVGQPHAAIIDTDLTRVVDSVLVKVFSWYDNEVGYVSSLIEHIKKIDV